MNSKSAKNFSRVLSFLLCVVLCLTAVNIPLNLANASTVTVPENLIPNGTFDTGVEGWKLWTSTYSKGKLSWDESAKALNFEKTSSSPELYCAAVKVESGTLLDFSYDFKTSVEITDTLKATSVAFFAYTSEYIESVGTTMFAPNSANAQYTVEFVLSGTEWQTKRMTYTVPEGYEYVQIRFAYRGQSPNTILSLDNICLYEIDENYALFKISNALENNDAATFNTWIASDVLGIDNLSENLYSEYFKALKNKSEISKDVIQATVNGFASMKIPTPVLGNATFDSDVSGWKIWTSSSSKGTLSWDESSKALNFTKTSGSPEIYSAAMKVESGALLDFSYDFKTSVEITDTLKATSIAFFAYTSEYIESIGTTMFAPSAANSKYTTEFVLSGAEWQTKRMTYTVPEGYEYVQIRFAYRGQTPANTVLSLDNIYLYKVDEEYALYKVSKAVIDDDKYSLEYALKSEILGLQNIVSSNRELYMSALKQETNTLTKARLQEIINIVNSLCNSIPLLANGTFDSTVAPWRAFNASTPSAVHSAENGGAALLSQSAKMLSEVIDVSYGDLIHIEFDAKATANGTKLTVTGSQFTESELRRFGEASATEGNESAISTTEAFNLTTEFKHYVMDVKITDGVWGLVVALALQNGTVYIDNVAVSRSTKEYVNGKLNEAIANGDAVGFEKWMKYKASALVYELIKVDGNLMTELKTAQTNKGANLTAKEIAAVVASGVTDIGSRLELFVDDTLIDTQNTTADLQVMKPTFGGQVLDLSGGFVCKDIANSDYSGAFDPSRITEDTRPWENLGADYGNVIKVGDKYLYYYRGVDDEVTTVTGYTSSKDGRPLSHYMNVCVAESEDGINWTRPELGLYDFVYEGENLPNNIIIGNILENYNGGHLSSFAAFEDKSPNANPEKPYKGMLVIVKGQGWGFDLFAMESADGIHWDHMNNGKAVISSNRTDIMDSINIVFWSEEAQEYKLYFRMWNEDAEYGEQRAVAVLSSKDFVNWDDLNTESVFLDYYSDYTDEELISRNEGYDGIHPDAYQLYTNGIQTYDRAPHIYIGMPTRYLGKSTGYEVAPYLVAGRDGVNFKYWDTMLVEPSEELGRDGNRSNYAICGIFQTSETEYSFLACRGFKDSKCIIDRFSFRVDGFVSAVGDSTGKILAITPVIFDGNSLILNYKAPNGTVRAQLTDVNGNVLEGFGFDDCVALTGDSIEQELKWKGDLSKIDQPVKIYFELVNAELYSYKFTTLEKKVEFDMLSLGSIRHEIDEDGKYVSAGIRFRGQVSEQFKNSATEIGFVAVPTENLNGMLIADYVKTEGNIAITAKTKAEGMNEIVYAVSTDNEGNKYYDYQLIITGLTRKGVEVNLLDTEITVAMYAVIDGETVYTNTKSASYNYIASLMNR